MINETEHAITVPGGELYAKHWQLAGSQLAPIILLHDSLGSVAQWRHFPTSLSQATGRSVIAYDRLGFGQSSTRTKPASFTFIEEEAAVYLPAVAAAFALEHYVLFGHSVGGGMAITAAAQHGQQCLAVVSESAQAFVEQRTLEGIRAAQQAFADAQQFARLARWHGERAQWVLDAWTKVWLHPSYREWSLDAELQQVYCPVLAIHGDGDEFGSEAFPKRIVAIAKGPTQLELLPGMGHVPHRENEALVVNTVSQFLTKHAVQ